MPSHNKDENYTENNSSNLEAIELINSISKTGGYYWSVNSLSKIKAYEQVKKLEESKQKEIILSLSNLVSQFTRDQAEKGYHFKYASGMEPSQGRLNALAVQSGMLRKKLNYTEEEWIVLFKSFISSIEQLSDLPEYPLDICQFPINYSIKQLEYFLKKNPVSAKFRSFIKEILKLPQFSADAENNTWGSDMRKATKKLSDLIAVDGEVPTFHLKTNDIGDEINKIIDRQAEHQESIAQIFSLASSVSGGKPSKKFSLQVSELQEAIGLENYRKLVHEILAVPLKRGIVETTKTYSHGNRTHDYTEIEFLCSPSKQFIKGVVWTMNRFSDKESIRLLTKLTEKSYQKIPQKGPAAAALGNACVFILGNMRGKDGLGALSRLKLKVKQNNVKKSIDRYLLEGAKKYNVSVEELKEMAVPDFNLINGKKTFAFDDYTLELSIDGRKVKQQWIKPDGSPMKSVPSVAKNNAALAKKLKEARKEAKEIQKIYSAQKQRIDNQFILDRIWDFPSFQKFYLNHGLVSPIATKLIWTFSKNNNNVNVIFQEGKWFSKDNTLVDWIDSTCTVKLWHPVTADEATIVDWRDRMIALEWKQPIKQAFREIYILTDAEVNTQSYSNRMASHILKQHQFSSLANLRGWKYSLMGTYDDGRDDEICSKYLPEYSITAEYWIDELNQDDAWNDAGIWLYIATDQVKFKDADGNAMNLVQVPKMVFTEIMRDVDLFVGVASVGNDPQWMDNNGARQTNRDYWTSYSFGDLTEIAKTRKTILEGLLPRLKKIRDVAKIEGKFLKINGKLRNYKIHIGSGNILMEPNDQYLCIVPARSAENTTDKLFIPFEGDRGLSIVLSKAFLLAEDDKITDSSIVSQINRN